MQYSLSPSRCTSFVASVWFANIFAITGSPQQRPELRCGWFVNPTPSSAWLIEREHSDH